MIDKKWKTGFFLAACLLAFAGWYLNGQLEARQKQRIVKLSIAQRVKQHRSKTIQICKTNAYNSALIKVDSLLQVITALEMRDTNPLKPTKPLRPVLDTIIDTIDIEPLFYDSLGSET